MPPTACPHCGSTSSTSTSTCSHCGRSLGSIATASAHPVATLQPPTHADPTEVTAPPPEAARPAVSLAAEHPFFPVPASKFAVLSLFSLGIYTLYWCYRNWKRIEQRSGEGLSPFWRTFFAPLWGFSLFGRIHEFAVRKHLSPAWDGGALGFGFLILNVTWRLPDPWWMTSLLAFVPVIPVVRTVERINDLQPATEGRNARYSGLGIATIIVGGLILLLAVLGTLFPEAEGGA